MIIDWGQLVVTVGGGLLLFWLGAGMVAIIQHRRSVKADVSGKEDKARAEFISDLQATIAMRTAERDYALEQLTTERRLRRRAEAIIRILEDHAYEWRRHARDHGCTDIPRWPSYPET